MRLRWEISKALHRPLDDPMFDRMHAAQWLLYAALLQQDRQEEYETWRNRIEYLARFWSNEAVDQVQAAREQAKGSSDSQFEKMLKRTFGRGLGSAIQKDMSVQELGQQIDQA